MRFFKKAGPSTPIWMAGGEPLVFATLDGRTGYLATDDAAVIAHLEKCIKERRGGLAQIQEDEFKAFEVQKKTGNISAPSRDREAFGGGVLKDTVSPRAVPVAAVPVAIEQSAEPVVTPMSTAPIDPVKAKASRRVGKKPAPSEEV